MIAAASFALSFAPSMAPVVSRPRVATAPLSMAATDWQRPAMTALLAVALTFGPADDAMAARSGGRVGGRAPSMSRPSSSMSRPSMSRPAPTPQRTTNIYMAPSMGMGYGGMGYGGYGMGYGGGNGLGLYLGISVAGAGCEPEPGLPSPPAPTSTAALVECVCGPLALSRHR